MRLEERRGDYVQDNEGLLGNLEIVTDLDILLYDLIHETEG